MTHHALPRVRPRRQRPRWVIPLAAAAVVVVIGLVGGWLALSGDEEPEVPVVPVKVTTAPTSSAAPPTTASIGPVETGSAGAVKSPVVAFGEGPDDGLWPVSTEGRAEGLTIAPGTYRTAGAADTAETGRCSWERHSGLVKSRNLVRGPVEIRLQAGDHFRSQGCQQWIRGSSS